MRRMIMKKIYEQPSFAIVTVTEDVVRTSTTTYDATQHEWHGTDGAW